MRRLACVAAVCAAVAFAGPARAQSLLPFSVEGRAGLAFATGDLGEDLSTGYVLGANVGFNLMPLITLYGGYSYITFDLDDDVPGAGDATWNVSGFDAGARVNLPMIGFSPYVRGGVVYYESELSDLDGESNLGFQVGAGLDFPLGAVVSITPEVSYTQVDAGDVAGPDKTSFVRVDFGLRARL